jgi:hypothetical protein
MVTLLEVAHRVATALQALILCSTKALDAASLAPHLPLTCLDVAPFVKPAFLPTTHTTLVVDGENVFFEKARCCALVDALAAWSTPGRCVIVCMKNDKHPAVQHMRSKHPRLARRVCFLCNPGLVAASVPIKVKRCSYNAARELDDVVALAVTEALVRVYGKSARRAYLWTGDSYHFVGQARDRWTGRVIRQLTEAV